VKICRFRSRCRNFSAFFPTTRPMLYISKRPAGMVGSSARDAALWANHSGSKRARVFCAAPPAHSACRKDVSLMAGTVMERSHAPLSTWFWAAYPFNAFRSLFGIAGGAAAPTFDGLYSGELNHPTFSGCG